MASPRDRRRAAEGDSDAFRQIAEVAREIGVSPSALRLWERHRLVSPRRGAGGYRLYSRDDVDRLRLIHRLRHREGLNAPAIRRLLVPPAPDGRSAAQRHGSGRLARRLRDLRRARGLTLREVAARTGLSTSFISALERGLSGASVAALRRLVAAYDTTLGAIIDPPQGSSGRLVPAHEQEPVDTGAGVRIANLANAPTSLEPHLFILAPGASSQGGYSHAGEEFMYVLTGSLGVWLDVTEDFHRLSAGDALTFPSTIVHRFQALGDTETRLIWVNTPPTF